jgi:uncharacterized Rmd1/YagE family protein
MLPRVTGYCTCEAYKLVATQKFLTDQHGVKGAVIYDEALYARYELPLRNGEGGFRVRSGESKAADDSARDYSSDSETLSKRKHDVNGEGLDEEFTHRVGSSAMLDAQGGDELLFSPPKDGIDPPPTKVHFLDEEDQKAEPAPERILKRRDSTLPDLSALSNLAECIPYYY